MILLVDNRDSYTFNLAHLIAAAAGREPVVVRADDVEASAVCDRIRAGEFTHVVISPGPGTPESETDFGGSRAVIEAARDIPVLGVCLGHQGLACLAGARVGRTTPRHGYLSRVSHSGEGIFTGLPQEFSVVRYHSLHIETGADAGVDAETTAGGIRIHARSEDGVVQGLEVVGRPHWGVQFHPESVLTEYGENLMRNFLALAPAPTTWRVAHRQVEIDLDTEATFRALRGGNGDAFWLDSATGTGFTVMGTTAGSLSRALSYRRGEVDILNQLDAELRDGILTEGLPDIPFTGGWVGYLGYECAALTLPGFSPGHASAHPDAFFIRPQSFLVYDHAASRAHLLVLHHGQNEGNSETADLMRILRSALRTEAAAAAGASISQGAWRLTRGEYRERFEQIKQALARGDSYEVCLTDTFEAATDADGLDLYARLRRANPAPYAAYLALGDLEVLSSSPERFLTVREGTVETKPIKGTIPRSQPPSLLLDDPKTRAENLMIVDLLRNDLGRVCLPGTVHVPTLMAVETYATVHQLVSTVTGKLRPETSLIDLLRATFPGGSMTGAPKERTCELIDALEAGPRGVYSGSIGYLGFDGSADLSVVIRTAVKHGSTVTVGAGGAIVWDSDPDAEYAEMQLKARAVLRGLE
ncbi:aminodeoxychorismate synthase component I [Corynebacterium qintianiae]|uniref:aminodeoxychorismate synthase component I n=1 Tax=Corynebacterium qintianiae TaxID=2709392 RepID=UPI0013EAE0E9|nr:aminodeoxychorismate synthase component I [Corynebacterium qintianiae]